MVAERMNVRIHAALEWESGINDPMAILPVTIFISLLMQPEQTAAFPINRFDAAVGHER